MGQTVKSPQLQEKQEKPLPKTQSSIKQAKLQLIVEKEVYKCNEQQQNIKEETKMNSKMFGLVMYEVAKEQNSIFSEEEKFPIKISTVGVFLGLSAATLLNLSHTRMNLSEKYKKWFLISSLTNFIASLILGGYGIYHTIKLYRIVPEIEWKRIDKEKEDYQKLGLEEQKKFLTKSSTSQPLNVHQQQPQQTSNTNQKMNLTK